MITRHIRTQLRLWALPLAALSMAAMTLPLLSAHAQAPGSAPAATTVEATPQTETPPKSSPDYPTKGGAGGEVIMVTNLDDSGPGSFRAAVETKGPRIIKFSVAGEIWIKTNFVIRNPFLTIDGTSAPSPGITLIGDRIRVRSHDIIIRDVRLRVGELPTGFDPQNRDGFSLDGSEDGKDPGYNVLLDHCSIAWALDENVQMWGPGNHDYVVRDCIIGEGLSHSLHPKNMHSAGLIIGPNIKNVLLQRNLFISNEYRNPIVSGGADAIVVNNLTYNPGFGALQIYPREDYGPTLVSYIGNVIIAGKNTKKKLSIFHKKGINSGTKVYLRDNQVTGTDALDTTEMPTVPPGKSAEASPFVQESPLPLDHLQIMPVGDVKESVLANAGARPKERDALDLRFIAEVRENTGSAKDHPTDDRLKAPTPAPKVTPAAARATPSLEKPASGS